MNNLSAEYLSLSGAEERLEWLMERTPEQPFLSMEERRDDVKVPGCLSGLWIIGRVDQGRCVYRAASDSSMVAGVAAFVCDLYSGKTPQEILALGAEPATALKIENLLSMTRKRAVASVVSYILSFARLCNEDRSESI